MQPRHINAELGDRRRPDAAGDRVQLRAIASSARAIRSSFSNSGAMPYASSTAIAAAHSCTRTIGAGAVSRFATSASITSPWEIQATGRTGRSHR